MINFKKIASVASSTLMMGATVALAAAANYPAPFVSGGQANVAIVVGESAAFSDSSAASALSANLAEALASQGGSSGSTSTVTTGEAFPLFTSSSQLWLNSSINVARNTLTDDDLPTVLAEGDFSGDVDAQITQTIILNGQNRVLFGQEPTDNDDPAIYLDIGTAAGTGLYNTSIVFDNTINFTNSESKSEEMMLFGKEWTVGSDTTASELVLYKSSERITLSLGGSNPTPSQSVEVKGTMYTVELISGSDSDASIRVTDSSGHSESREINEDQSKKINGVEIALIRSDESDALGAITAEITVASDKIILSDGQEVLYGTDEDSIDGTLVDFVSTTITGNISQIIVQVFADDDDKDAIPIGGSWVDPVWGSFKVDFSNVNIDTDSPDREKIEVTNTGDDQLNLEFTDHRGNTKEFQWYDNRSVTRLAHGTDSDEAINVNEFAQINESEYTVIGNQDEGFLLELQTVSNATTGYTNDKVTFKDVFAGTTKDATITGEGVGTIDYGGKTYGLTYTDNAVSAARFVRLNYPDSASTNMVVFPTIESDKGAKVALYTPLTINFTANNAFHGQTSAIAGLVFPDGDDYATTLTTTVNSDGSFTFSGLSTATLNSTNAVAQANLTVGTLTYSVTSAANSSTLNVSLVQPGATTVITTPAVMIWEEEEDTDDRENALVVIPEGAGVDADGDGVSTVRSTSGLSGAATYTELESNNDLSQLMTVYGSIVQLDESETDQKTATIWYPDDQVQAMIYAAEGEAVISSDGSGSLGNIVVRADEMTGVAEKNLIVVGGSCVNSAARRLIDGTGSPICGADFTSKTQIGSGEFIIKSFSSPWSTGKTAILVAGYNADDTTNAAAALRTQTVDTTVGKAYKGTTATSITPILG